MDFIFERQSRRYFIFLAAFCALLLAAALPAGQLYARGTKRAVLERERAIVSSLLLSEVSGEAIAAALGNEEITGEGRAFLERTGRSERSDPWLFPAVREGARAFFFFAEGLAAGFCAVLLAVSAIFLKKREALYRDAQKTVTAFAEGNFSHRLSGGEEGTLWQLFEAVDQLSAALRTKGEAAMAAKEALWESVSNISHQLKTPLTALSMYTEIILEEPGNSQTVHEFAQKSQQALKRMEALIQTLLKVMRLDAGSVRFEKGACRASELIDRAAQELYVRAVREQKKILTEGDLEEELFCDPVWTAEAVSNLIKNALDHTASGGIIRIGWQRTPVGWRLWVADDGCGIEEEDMPHIFKRFYRSQKSSDVQGAGLGLALVKSVVEGQGGCVSVMSRPGEGAVFTVSFVCF